MSCTPGSVSGGKNTHTHRKTHSVSYNCWQALEQIYGFCLLACLFLLSYYSISATEADPKRHTASTAPNDFW